MPIFATFVMGSKETYFFNTPTHWAWHNLPSDIEALFTQTPPIKDVIELALGPNGAYFISYYDANSQITCKHYNLPNPMVDYLYASSPNVVRDLRTLSITIGPYDSYYAWDSASASWSNLPASLEKGLLARLETQEGWRTTWKANGAEAPSFVSLGADGAYFMRTICGGGSWDLKSGKVGDGREGWEGLRGSNKFLEDCADFNGVAGLHLFPSHPNSYIMILTTGKAFSNLPECTWADYNKLAPALPMFVQSMQPIPPIPQQRQQPQSVPQAYAQPMVQPPPQKIVQHPQAQQQHNCCPPNTPGAPHNCCPPHAPVQSQSYGAATGYGSAPYAAQPTGYATSAQSNGFVYR